MLEGDRELLLRLVKLFVLQSPQLLQEVREAVVCGDAGALERAAHKLRGAAANFGAGAACDVAQRLEQMGRVGDLTHAAEVQEELAMAMRGLQDVLVDFGKDRAT